MEKKRILIAGGGACGLMAAIMAAREGAAVTVLEHNETVGKKICATGNGKCNLTNDFWPEDALRGEHPEFAREIISQFGVADTLHFFEEVGIAPVSRGGYYYPRSGQARSVVEVLEAEARSRKVKIKTREHVKDVFSEGTIWKVRTEGWVYEGDAVILANGSCASAIAGSDGSGYALAKTLGHRIVSPYPALCALKCEGTKFSVWAGVRTEGEITLFIDGKVTGKARGELQLTEYGVSGIPVFQVSRYAVRAKEEGKKVSLTLNFLPEVEKYNLEEFFERRRRLCPYKSKKELLTGLFPEKLIRVLTEQKDLLKAVHAFPLTVKQGMPFEQAQVCSGGVSTEMIHSHTLESRLHRGLYFCGELVDIDGTCGGYNLQWAWSSGAVAGRHAAKEDL